MSADDTKGYNFFFGNCYSDMLRPIYVLLFPRRGLEGNCLLMLLAPTVMIHGATFVTVPGVEPSFQVEQTTTFPLWTPWNAPIAIAS